MPSSTQRCALTIVLPCLNEAQTVGSCVTEALGYLAKSGIPGEVLVADNGSTDRSGTIAASHGARVIEVPIRGYGAAIHAGCLAARGELIIIADADGSYDLANLAPFVEAMQNGADMVVGNRFRGGIQKGAMPWKNRYIGNPLLSFMGRLLFGNKVRDFHCGIRGIRTKAYGALDLSSRGMEFASEMIIKGLLADVNVAEVPATLRPDGRANASHLRPWRDGWRHIRLMLIFAPKVVFFYPGIALMALGGTLMIALAGGPRDVFGLILDIHTMLYGSFALLIGAQCLMFGAFVRIYSRVAGLQPFSPRLERLLKPLPLELGVCSGVLLLLLGIFGTISSVMDWSVNHFRLMNPQQGLRTVIPSTTALFLGLQIIVSSFFMSVLKMGVPHEDEPGPVTPSASADESQG